MYPHRRRDEPSFITPVPFPSPHAGILPAMGTTAMPPKPTAATPRIYDGDGDRLMSSLEADRVTLLPTDPALAKSSETVRILWGQPMLPDLLAGRYRSVVCGVNARDNSRGIIAQIAEMMPASQWSAKTITTHARLFAESVVEHGVTDATGADRQPFVIKYDLDSLEVFALLRPVGRDHFTLNDLARGFKQVAQMVEGRRARLPVASVSFLGARSNRLLDPATGEEPSFEAVLRTMHRAGFRGDVYPPPHLWHAGNVGVFPTYPFPSTLDRMRDGGF